MKTVVVISQDMAAVNIIRRILSPAYEMLFFRNAVSALGCIYDSLPALVIVDLSADTGEADEVLRDNIKADPMFRQLPVLAILPGGAGFPEDDMICFEDFLRRPYLEEELFDRTRLSLIRSERIVEINPLTRLPGNISIARQIEERLGLGRPFAMAYADLDHFKPFNDKYGFSRGDEVIKATGRIIMNCVVGKQPKNSFVGHVGGDDFIYLMNSGVIEEASAQILAAFNNFIPSLYDAAERRAGYITSTDRQGNVRQFPILRISIGITDSRSGEVSHPGQIIEAASRMKSFAKKQGGNIYCADKRLTNP